MVGIGEVWSNAGSAIASLMFLWAVIDRFIPVGLKTVVYRYANKLFLLCNPYIHIRIAEYTGEFFRRNEVYTAVEAYLTANSSDQAKNLNAEIAKQSQKLSLTIDTCVEVTDVFRGVKVWWYTGTTLKANTLSFSWYPDREEKRFYRLTFHSRHRNLITEAYLPHVINEGIAIGATCRRKKLFTNNASNSESHNKLWSSVHFDHPATFNTLAMDPTKKKELIDDLDAFRNRKGYYTRIGKAWKRGYLLYGPPGTGKSSMIAAMANFLEYDIYDLELTAVKDNTELRKLLFDTASKSIIVIEDIDCSLDLAGKRKYSSKDSSCDEESGTVPLIDQDKKKRSKVTLSGLLNFIDGLWSASGGERIIVFTTNHVEKLDPALIRRGRMDMHVELSYCDFEGFKVLAKNYLEVESHELFDSIQELIGEVAITPADVAENLMPKGRDVDVSSGLKNFVNVLVKVKEDRLMSAEKHDDDAIRGVVSPESKDEEIMSDNDNNAVEENKESETSL